MKALKYTTVFCLGFSIGFLYHSITEEPTRVYIFDTIETQEPEPTYQNETIYKPAPKYVDEFDSIYWKQIHY